MKSSKPIKLESNADLTTAKQRLVEIQSQRIAAEHKANEIQTQISALTSDRNQAGNKYTAKALALLSGGALLTDTSDATLRQDLGTVREELNVLREAERLQCRVVDDIKSYQSVIVNEERRADHQTLVRKIAAAVQTLLEANEAEYRFREEIVSNDYYCHLTPMLMTDVGLASDPHARGNDWLIEAVKRGFIDVATLPAHVRAFMPSQPKPNAPEPA